MPADCGLLMALNELIVSWRVFMVDWILIRMLRIGEVIRELFDGFGGGEGVLVFLFWEI